MRRAVCQRQLSFLLSELVHVGYSTGEVSDWFNVHPFLTPRCLRQIVNLLCADLLWISGWKSIVRLTVVMVCMHDAPPVYVSADNV